MTATPAGRGVFVSYRRGDAPGWAGRIRDRLVASLGPESVFMDIDSLEPGLVYREVIADTLETCAALVAVIGLGWYDASNADGTRRLTEEDDLLVEEIAIALDQGKRVIPVLVEGADTPSAADLPDRIAGLAERHSVVLSQHTASRDLDDLVQLLVDATSREAATQRPFIFDGRTFLSAADLGAAMAEDWEAATRLVSGPELKELEFWATSQGLPGAVLAAIGGQHKHGWIPDRAVAEVVVALTPGLTPTFMGRSLSDDGLAEMARRAAAKSGKEREVVSALYQSEALRTYAALRGHTHLAEFDIRWRANAEWVKQQRKTLVDEGRSKAAGGAKRDQANLLLALVDPDEASRLSKPRKFSRARKRGWFRRLHDARPADEEQLAWHMLCDALAPVAANEADAADDRREERQRERERNRRAELRASRMQEAADAKLHEENRSRAAKEAKDRRDREAAAEQAQRDKARVDARRRAEAEAGRMFRVYAGVAVAYGLLVTAAFVWASHYAVAATTFPATTYVGFWLGVSLWGCIAAGVCWFIDFVRSEPGVTYSHGWPELVGALGGGFLGFLLLDWPVGDVAEITRPALLPVLGFVAGHAITPWVEE